MNRNEAELTNDFPSLIGTPTFLDLHDVSHRELRIVQAERYPPSECPVIDLI